MRSIPTGPEDRENGWLVGDGGVSSGVVGYPFLWGMGVDVEAPRDDDERLSKPKGDYEP